jgi:hypothetical protein
MLPEGLRELLVAAAVGAATALASQFVTVASLKAEVEAIARAVDANHTELAQWMKSLSDKQDDMRDRVSRIEGQLGAAAAGVHK